MKKVLIAVVVAVALVVWVASWFWADEAVSASGTRDWPAGLGPLSSVSSRFPPHPGNEASQKLLAMAPQKSDAVDEYVIREVARPELTIGEPPALPDVAAMRDLLLRETVVWERFETFDDPEASTRRAIHMTMARSLVAAALVKARANDAAAWEDLHAVWRLARSLDEHPQTMVRTAALTIARMINGLAWKMPQPAPSWFAELQSRDEVRPLLEAYQFQTESYRRGGGELFPTKWLADAVEHDRGIAEAVHAARGCEVEVPMNQTGVDVRSVWRRVLRFRAEREATENALRVRRGEPIVATSACTKATWSFDGTTLRLSRDIPAVEKDIAMPLVLRLR